jgi:polar amino acid transport system substrate-binding protein
MMLPALTDAQVAAATAPPPAALPVLYVATLQQLQPDHPVAKLVGQAYQNIGVRMQLEALPLERTRLELSRGRWLDANLAAAATFAAVAPELIRIDVPVYQLELAVFSRADRGLSADVSQLKGQQVAYLHGMHLIEVMLHKQGVLRLQPVTTLSQILQGLDKGRYDAAVLPRREAEAMIKQLKLSQVVWHPPILTTIPLYHYLHRKHQRLLEPLTAQLRLLTGGQPSVP